MKIKKFRLIQVRNFENIEIETDKNITIFTGKNGAGKTNLLESVNLASFGKSFRTNKDEELIKFDKNECTTILTFNSGKSNHEIKIKISKTNGKQIFLNENRIKNLIDTNEMYILLAINFEFCIYRKVICIR